MTSLVLALLICSLETSLASRKVHLQSCIQVQIKQLASSVQSRMQTSYGLSLSVAKMQLERTQRTQPQQRKTIPIVIGNTYTPVPIHLAELSRSSLPRIGNVMNQPKDPRHATLIFKIFMLWLVKCSQNRISSFYSNVYLTIRLNLYPTNISLHILSRKWTFRSKKCNKSMEISLLLWEFRWGRRTSKRGKIMSKPWRIPTNLHFVQDSRCNQRVFDLPLEQGISITHAQVGRSLSRCPLYFRSFGIEFELTMSNRFDLNDVQAALQHAGLLCDVFQNHKLRISKQWNGKAC